jgi:hypothetical protein
VTDGGGAILDVSTTLVGNAFGGPTGERGPSAATVQVLSLASGPDTLSLGLIHDFASAGIYADPLGSIIAVPAEDALLAISDVVALDLPAGDWAIYAKATPVNLGGADYARCVLYRGATATSSATTLVGNAAPGFTGELGPSAATLEVQTLVSLAAVETIRLSCGHDFSFAGEYVDPGAAILALPVEGPIDAN